MAETLFDRAHILKDVSDKFNANPLGATIQQEDIKKIRMLKPYFLIFVKEYPEYFPEENEPFYQFLYTNIFNKGPTQLVNRPGNNPYTKTAFIEFLEQFQEGGRSKKYKKRTLKHKRKSKKSKRSRKSRKH
jgi:hypothetical protein